MSNTNTLNVIHFTSRAALKSATESYPEGTICITHGYYENGDGGGAKYKIESIADNTDALSEDKPHIFKIGNNTQFASIVTDAKPVSILQFGAISSYNEEVTGTKRDDSVAIQCAIDFTDANLFASNDLENAVTGIVIPGGVYYLKEQIKIPPYLHFILEGAVQFKCKIGLDKDGEFYGLKLGDACYSQIPMKSGSDTEKDLSYTYFTEEVLAPRSYILSDGAHVDTSLPPEQDPLCVYKKGAIKICYNYDENGHPKNPFLDSNLNSKYRVSPSMFRPIFDGTGSLTLLNNINNTVYVNKSGDVIIPEDNNTVAEGYYSQPLFPRYICGIEIGNSKDYFLRYHDDVTENDIKFYDAALNYENLRISNVNTCQFAVGILVHAFEYYNTIISDCDFFSDTVGYQYGLYGEPDKIRIISTDRYDERNIVGEESHEGGEMIHFRDNVFTQNWVDVNIMLSGSSHSFDGCHFDFSRCVFRAAYSAQLFLNHCHIEGVGDDFRVNVFNDPFITQSDVQNFLNANYPIPYSKFYGILYAKPQKKFTRSYSNDGSYDERYTYSRDNVNLVITNSNVADNYILPLPMLTFAGKFNDEEAFNNDGHRYSTVKINNVTYTVTYESPVCYLSVKDDNGIIYSGFLSSEFADAGTSTESDLHDQNALVDVKNSLVWKKYGGYDRERNTRFSANRNLVLKYPYFQNVRLEDVYSSGQYVRVITGVEIDRTDLVMSTIDIFKGSRPQPTPFKKFDNNAACLQASIPYYSNELYSKTTTGFESVEKNAEGDPVKVFSAPKYTVRLNNDKIICNNGDVYKAALVTDKIPTAIGFTDVSDQGLVNTATGREISFKKNCDVLSHKILFTEYDFDGNAIGTYAYTVGYPYRSKLSEDINEGFYDIDMISTEYYCSTNTCKHRIRNTSTAFMVISAEISVPYCYGDPDGIDDYMNCEIPFKLAAVLIEKDS